jgi:hypothetical protein
MPSPFEVAFSQDGRIWVHDDHTSALREAGGWRSGVPLAYELATDFVVLNHPSAAQLLVRDALVALGHDVPAQILISEPPLGQPVTEAMPFDVPDGGAPKSARVRTEAKGEAQSSREPRSHFSDRRSRRSGASPKKLIEERTLRMKAGELDGKNRLVISRMGVDPLQFLKAFQDKTATMPGMPIYARVAVFDDLSFSVDVLRIAKDDKKRHGYFPRSPSGKKSAHRSKR